MTRKSTTKKEDWMNSKWRPMMGWMYMLVCVTDFIVFPILWSLLQAHDHGTVTSQWQPLTLQGAGLFHMAMGAIIGVSAFGRTQEKIAGANNGGNNFGSGFGTTYQPPAATPVASGFGNPMPSTSGFGNPMPSTSGFGNPMPSTSGFGTQPTTQQSSSGFGNPSSNTSGFGNQTPAASQPAQVVTGFGGKPGPAPAPQPII